MQRSLPRCQAARISLAANSLGDTSPTFWGRSPAEYPSNWSDERVELLKKLWADGLSASRIATEPGEVTRNAVIGKAQRLGLESRAVTRRIKPAQKQLALSDPFMLTIANTAHSS